MSSPASKRRRLSPPESAAATNSVLLAPPSENNRTSPESEEPELLPDSHIDSKAALQYWTSTPATVSGVLGGYPQLSKTDLQGSANFLAKLRRSSANSASKKLSRAVDCGAGIGRITEGLLQKVAERVDVVEPATNFCNEVRKRAEEGRISGLGTVWEVGLEDWTPFDEGGHLEKQTTDKAAATDERYDLIWNQWCLGQLNDRQLTDYLARSKQWVKLEGLIVVKENLSNLETKQDIFDSVDSSVTRTKEKFESIFAEAGLEVTRTELQRGFPKELYPVRIWGLRAPQ